MTSRARGATEEVAASAEEMSALVTDITAQVMDVAQTADDPRGPWPPGRLDTPPSGERP